MRSKFLSFAAVLALVFATSSWAKTPPKQQPTYSSSSSHSGSGMIDWGVAGPLTLIGGTAYWGATVTGLYEIMPDLSIGGETGFQFASATGATLWNIPILLSGRYMLHIQGLGSNMKPFVGLGIGMGIASAGVSVAVGSVTVGASSTSAVFEMMAHAGMIFSDHGNKGLFARLSMGVMSSSFAFAPSVGYYF